MAEQGENPIKKGAQEPDDQDKDTAERVKKQDVTKEETGRSGAGEFIKGTATPDIQK